MREARLYLTAEPDTAEKRRASSPGPHVWVDLRALDFASGDHLLPRDALTVAAADDARRAHDPYYSHARLRVARHARASRARVPATVARASTREVADSRAIDAPATARRARRRRRVRRRRGASPTVSRLFAPSATNASVVNPPRAPGPTLLAARLDNNDRASTSDCVLSHRPSPRTTQALSLLSPRWPTERASRPASLSV